MVMAWQWMVMTFKVSRSGYEYDPWSSSSAAIACYGSYCLWRIRIDPILDDSCLELWLLQNVMSISWIFVVEQCSLWRCAWIAMMTGCAASNVAYRCEDVWSHTLYLLIDACSTLTSLRKWRRILIHSPGSNSRGRLRNEGTVAGRKRSSRNLSTPISWSKDWISSITNTCDAALQCSQWIDALPHLLFACDFNPNSVSSSLLLLSSRKFIFISSKSQTFNFDTLRLSPLSDAVLLLCKSTMLHFFVPLLSFLGRSMSSTSTSPVTRHHGSSYGVQSPWYLCLRVLNTRRLLVVSIGGWRVERRKSDFCKEILVQDHFYRKYWLNHKLFRIGSLFCLPLLMMNVMAPYCFMDSPIVSRGWAWDFVRGDFVSPNTPFIECDLYWFISFSWNWSDSMHFDDRVVDAVFERTLCSS